MKPKILTKTPPRIQKHSLGSSIPEIINATSKYPLFQSKRVKILDENLNLLTDKPLQLLSSHPQCYIIGFIGKAGVGKSTLANLLTRSEGSRNESTHGIDLWMLPQGIIILDTFPIFSRSVYNRNKHESVLGADDWMQRNANNLAHFLFSVCHVVIAVSDRVDEKFWGFLKNVAVNKSGDFAPRIVACINKQMPESFDNVCSANEVFGGFFSDDACDISLSRAYPHYQPTPNFWMLPSQSLTISIDIDIFENGFIATHLSCKSAKTQSASRYLARHGSYILYSNHFARSLC